MCTEEYEVQIKMVQEQWLKLRIIFLLGYKIKIVFSGREKPLVAGQK